MIFKSLSILFFMIFTGQAFGLCVKSYKAQLHSSPRSNAPITWTLGQYSPLLKIKRKGNWYQVQDQDGRLHWIHRGKVENKSICVSVRVNQLNMRTGPGKKYPLAKYRYAEKYEAFKRIKMEGDWFKLQSSIGEIGWAKSSLLWRPVHKIYLEY